MSQPGIGDGGQGLPMARRLLNRGVIARLECDAKYSNSESWLGKAPTIESARATLVAALRLLAILIEEDERHDLNSIDSDDLRVLADQVDEA